MAARPHPFLLLAALLLLIGVPSSAGARNGKVPVELYYESLCPPSAQFVTDRLAEAFKDGLLEAADVTLVPYGNTMVGKDGTITCEHGPEECLLNTVEACTIDAWPAVIVHFGFINCAEELVTKFKYQEWQSCLQKQGLDPKPVMNVHFGFINCVEELVMNETQGEWESCFQKLGLDPKAVTECSKSEHGHKLSLKYGKQTGALVPPLTGVPWVVVDGKPRGDGDFVSYICKAYKGRPPKICEEPDRRHYPTVVEAGNGVSYNSGGFKLDDGVDDKIEVA